MNLFEGADSEGYVAWVAIFCMLTAGELYRIRTATYSGNGVSAEARTIRMSEVLHNTQTLLGIAGFPAHAVLGRDEALTGA